MINAVNKIKAGIGDGGHFRLLDWSGKASPKR